MEQEEQKQKAKKKKTAYNKVSSTGKYLYKLSKNQYKILTREHTEVFKPFRLHLLAISRPR